MDNSDKSIFVEMLNITMGLTNRFPLTDDEIKAWWNGLCSFEIGVIRSALDTWVDASNKPPTPHDIKQLCKPKPDFYKAIGHVADEDVKKEGLKEIETFIAKNTESKKDYKAWAKRILRNPQNFPDSSVTAAKEALNMENKS